jgi:nucleoside 2-deoxyribosyltransferase
MKIYIATALGNFQEARDWAEKFRAAGHKVTSKWIDSVDSESIDPTLFESRYEILTSNLYDLKSADVVFVITRDESGKATYSEIGYALALGMRVVWFIPGYIGGNIFDVHSLVDLAFFESEVMGMIDQ